MLIAMLAMIMTVIMLIATVVALHEEARRDHGCQVGIRSAGYIIGADMQLAWHQELQCAAADFIGVGRQSAGPIGFPQRCLTWLPTTQCSIAQPSGGDLFQWRNRSSVLIGYRTGGERREAMSTFPSCWNCARSYRWFQRPACSS